MLCGTVDASPTRKCQSLRNPYWLPRTLYDRARQYFPVCLPARAVQIFGLPAPHAMGSLSTRPVHDQTACCSNVSLDNGVIRCVPLPLRHLLYSFHAGSSAWNCTGFPFASCVVSFPCARWRAGLQPLLVLPWSLRWPTPPSPLLPALESSTSSSRHSAPHDIGDLCRQFAHRGLASCSRSPASHLSGDPSILYRELFAVAWTLTGPHVHPVELSRTFRELLRGESYYLRTFPRLEFSATGRPFAGLAILASALPSPTQASAAAGLAWLTILTTWR